MEQFTKQFRSLANAHTMSVPALFPGVVETLQALEAQDFLLAVATGKGRQGLDRDLRALKVGHFFAPVTGAAASAAKWAYDPSASKLVPPAQTTVTAPPPLKLL